MNQGSRSLAGSHASCLQQVWRGLFSHRWQLPSVILVLALVGLFASDLWRIWRITNHHDLQVFMLAARRLLAGEDIYRDALPFKSSVEAGTFSMKGEAVVWPYAYAPTIALLFAPFMGLPERLVELGWWTVNVLSLLLGAWLSLRAMFPTGAGVAPAHVALLLLLFFRFDPVVVALRLGQIELLQFLLLALTLYGLTRNQRRRLWERVAGVALGLATALKFFPGALIALLIWRRRWRPAVWAGAVALAAVGASFAITGWQAVRDYAAFARMYGVGGAFAGFPLNQSFNGFFSRNLIPNVFSPTLKGWDLTALAKVLILSVDLMVLGISAWLTWHPQPWPAQPSVEDDTRFALEFGLAVLALLLVSPHSQVYTYTWAGIPLVALAVWLLQAKYPSRRVGQAGGDVGWGPWVVLVLAYLLMGRHFMLYRPGLTRLVEAHYLFGALMAWGIYGVILWRWRSLLGRVHREKRVRDAERSPAGLNPIAHDGA
ncbi:MAG: DUF2029 domain-containing protein [Anaerolineae bacterium]|nr:DUF2029 domain-containing protein [Anaerolineae bacterium]